MVVDLSVVVNAQSNKKSIKPKTFVEFSEYVFVELNSLSRRSASIDIECDLNRESLNIKESIQTERGIGVQLNFDNDTDFSSDFASHFLGKNESKRVFYLYLVTESKRVFYPYLVNESKRVFYPYLVDKILGKACYKDKIVVVTRN